jgi:hypothetical protein
VTGSKRQCDAPSSASLAGVRNRTVVFAAIVLAGCGAQASQQTSAKPPVGSGHRARPPAVVQLKLELPLVGFSSASTVSFATTARAPMLRGSVQPAGATVYMLSGDGSRVAVNPRADGTFSVRAKLLPGDNTFEFTAAQLGAHSRTANLAVSWRGPAAEAMRRAMAADPAKFLPPASAGINRKLPPLGDLPAISQGATAVSFALNPIKAPPPPATGRPGRWLDGFELTEYYPALEAWFKGAMVSTPGLGSEHRIDWLYSAHGLSMEGDGIGLDGRPYHVSNVGAGGWVTAGGGGGVRFGVGADAPYWRTGGFWRTVQGALTFPLLTGGWSNGAGVKYVPPPAGITFRPGPSRQLQYLRSIAVDPSVIPMGSHVYIPS